MFAVHLPRTNPLTLFQIFQYDTTGNKAKNTVVRERVKFMAQIWITIQHIWEKKPAWLQTIDYCFILKISKFFPKDINCMSISMFATLEFGIGSTWSLVVTLSIVIFLSLSRFTLTSYLISGRIESAQPVTAKSCSSNCFLFIQDCLIMLLRLTSSSLSYLFYYTTNNILDLLKNIWI